jgi:DNA polymerase-3 subunit alpha
MLSSAREELVKTIQIRLPVDIISDDLVEDLTKHTLKHLGSTNLKILVYDTTENISIDLFSRSHRISLDDELISYLEGNHEIEFKLF